MFSLSDNNSDRVLVPRMFLRVVADKSCCLAVVIDIADCCQRLSDVVVDHSIHRHGDRVLCQHLLRWNIKADSPHVHDPTLVNTGDDEEQARSNCSTLLNPSKSEDDSPLILLNNPDAEEDGDWEG